MSKDEAWAKLYGAWSQRCGEYCVSGCNCDQEFETIKEIINV